MEIRTATKEDYPRILKIWENSVRQTHDFLREEDLQLYKKLIPTHFLPALSVFMIEQDDSACAFFAVSDDNLEMLFVDSAYRGRGLGQFALHYVVDVLAVLKVDVNEQNQQAVNFYLKRGYRVISRSEKDGIGKDYPLLHLHHARAAV